MSMGRRPTEEQGEFWVPTADLPRSPGHVFYDKLNRFLADAGFDRRVETLCRPLYADELGRASIPPGVYFRMLLVGYFEGIDSQRGIAWRCADSLSLRSFLGVPIGESTPDHSSLTRIRDRLPLEIHEEVFVFVLELAQERKLLRGKTVAIDATTLEANAALRNIVRKDTGEDYKTYLKRLLGLRRPFSPSRSTGSAASIASGRPAWTCRASSSRSAKSSDLSARPRARTTRAFTSTSSH